MPTDQNRADFIKPLPPLNLFRGSLTDPAYSFRQLVEAQRTAALSQEAFLQYQLETLQQDLQAIRNVIIGCDAALAASTPIEPTEEQITPPPGPIDPPVVLELQSEFEKARLVGNGGGAPGSKVDDGAPVPAFLAPKGIGVAS